MIVGVYGTLKKSFWNNDFLRGSVYLGQAVTLDKFSLGHIGYPAICPKEKKGAQVLLELYDVDKETLRRLDRLEGYPSFYDRREFRVLIWPDKRITLKATIYYFRKEAEGFDFFTPKGGVWEWKRDGWHLIRKKVFLGR